MLQDYSMAELSLYFFIYAFLGWAVQVVCLALKEGHFVNRGLLNLPISVPSGITMVILLVALPPLDGHTVLQYIASLLILNMVDILAAQFVRNISRRSQLGDRKGSGLSWQAEAVINVGESLVYLCLYLVIHPFLYLFMTWVPEWLVLTADVLLWLALAVDFLGVGYALHSSTIARGAEVFEEQTQKIGDRLSRRIWARLEKAYPGVERTRPEQQGKYVFAQGICFDKLVWVFLVSSFLGALIEMVYCRVMGDAWMSRSSVLYGAFSFVWGFGAVVLTVVLQRLAGKEDRKVFLAGFLVGGVYEYLCSVFTELVFGTVFWDYSRMPLNIGGRTNVLYCIFWGILAVVWIKVLYPPMDRSIEKIPPLTGKILTWAIVFVMLCNGLLTAGAMVRYTQRQTQPEPASVLEAYLDEHYSDSLMEARWPNMKITEQ